MPGPAFFTRLGLYVALDFFDLTLCERLRSEMCVATNEKATVIKNGEPGVLDESSRKVACANLSKATTCLVKQRLVGIKPKLEEHFQVRLADPREPEFLSYAKGAFYKRHRDASTNAPAVVQGRRVSAVAFLNRPSKEPTPGCYGGGALTFYGLLDGAEWEKCAFSLDPECGLLIAFRSDTLHEVQPVTFGLRLTVVSWFFTDEARTE